MIAQILALLVMPIQERFDISLRTSGAIHSALFDSVARELALDAPTARFLAVEELAPLIGWDAVGEAQREIILGAW